MSLYLGRLDLDYTARTNVALIELLTLTFLLVGTVRWNILRIGPHYWLGLRFGPLTGIYLEGFGGLRTTAR